MDGITNEWFLEVETNYGGKFVKGPVAICTLLEKKKEKKVRTGKYQFLKHWRTPDNSGFIHKSFHENKS